MSNTERSSTNNSVYSNDSGVEKHVVVRQTGVQPYTWTPITALGDLK